MRRVFMLLGAGLSLLLMSILPATGAVAPKLTLDIPINRVDQGVPFTITVSSAELPSGSKLYLQRQVGTKKTFKNVATVPASGSVTAPAAPVGKYLYRLVAVRAKKVVAQSRTRTLYAYGDLTVKQLCDRSEGTYFDGYCGSGSIRVGDKVFTYEASNTSQEGPDGDSGVRAQGSSCRSAHLDYAVSNDSADDGVTAVGLGVYQEEADPQQSVTPTRQIGTADFALLSPAWDLVFWTEGYDGYRVMWRGTFNCYTTDGDA